jgi:hypothetical protein
MHVAIGSDHAGFELKEAVKTLLAAEHHEVVDDLVGPALAAGGRVVVMGEEWQTAEAMCRVSDLLHGWATGSGRPCAAGSRRRASDTL